MRQQHIQDITTAFEAKRRALAAEFAAANASAPQSEGERVARLASRLLSGCPAARAGRVHDRARIETLQNEPMPRPRRAAAPAPAGWGRAPHTSIPQLLRALTSVAGRSQPETLVRLLELLTLELASPDRFDAHHTPAFLRDRAAQLGGVETVLGLLDGTSASPAVSASASHALAALVDGSPRIATVAVTNGALPGLVRLVELAGASNQGAAACVEGAAAGCGALGSIAAAGDGCIAAVCASGAPAAAVRAIAAATDCPDVSRGYLWGEACGLLARVCHVPEGARAVVQAGGVPCLCRVLDERPERPTVLAALEVLTVIAEAAKQRAGMGRRTAQPYHNSGAPMVAEALAGTAPRDPSQGGSERRSDQGVAFGHTSAEAALRQQWAGQHVSVAKTDLVPPPGSVFSDQIRRILESLPPMTAAKALQPVRRELESRMGLAPGSLLAEQAEIDRGIRRAKEAKAAAGVASEHRTAHRTLAADAEAEAAAAMAADASLAQLARTALRRDGVGGCLVRTLKTVVTGTARHDWRGVCATCAALEALLSPNGALGDHDSRRALVSEGLLGALALAVGSAPHGEVSNDFDDLPDRFTSKGGASTNVVCRASRLMSLLSPDGLDG